MRVYLDTCAIQRPLDDPAHLRVRLEAEAVRAVIAAAEQGAFDLVTSDVLRFEVGANANPTRRDFALGVLHLARHDVRSTPSVEARARLYLGAGVKPLDAVHLASAVEASADLFCTTDGPLLRRAAGLNTSAVRVVGPLELASLLAL